MQLDQLYTRPMLENAFAGFQNMVFTEEELEMHEGADAKIDKGRQVGNLSSAIRIFVLEHFRAKANGQAESGRAASGKGSPV